MARFTEYRRVFSCILFCIGINQFSVINKFVLKNEDLIWILD